LKEFACFPVGDLSGSDDDAAAAFEAQEYRVKNGVFALDLRLPLLAHRFSESGLAEKSSIAESRFSSTRKVSQQDGERAV
jgi:hypothetical protein